VKHITDSIFASGTIQSALTAPAHTDKEEVAQEQSINNYIQNLVGSRADLACVTIYSNKDEIYIDNIRRLKDVEPSNDIVLDELQEKNSKFVLFGPRYQITGSGYQRNIITVGRQLKDLDNGEVIGYLIIDIDYSILQKTIGMSNKDETTALLITDSNDRIIYNSENSDDVTLPYQETDTYHMFADTKKAQIVTITSENFEWSYRMLSNGEALLGELSKVALTFMTVGLASFIIFLICSILISKSVSKPLRRLEDAMRNAESNHFNEILPSIDTYGEVNRLTRRFNVMLVEIQRLLEREKDLWQKQAESEYKALQLQITPHFLYNSLDSINCLALVHGRKDISEMVLSLAGIFKYNMRYDAKLATMGDEINHVKNYCMLQAVHYQDSFRIEYAVEDSLLDREVVKFMLQPLVENAIYHGLKEKDMGDLIRIAAYETGQELVVQVADNGAGMNPDKEEALRTLLQKPSSELFKLAKDNHHIGLINVNLRLKLQYGEDAGITFDTKENSGTDMYIHIPFVTETLKK
jgi:two-component system sensor histidine kinase YesM